MAALWHTLLSPQVIPMIHSEVRRVYDGPVVTDARIPLDDAPDSD
jgi:hypothetical protein